MAATIACAVCLCIVLTSFIVHSAPPTPPVSAEYVCARQMYPNAFCLELVKRVKP